MPVRPPARSSWQPATRDLHDRIDAHMRATGRPHLHPDSPTLLYDLLGAEGMVSWQEGKVQADMLQAGCWSELPTVYGRYGIDPTRDLIRAMRRLYDAQACVITDCGAQAVAVAIDAVLRPGDHVLLARQIYGKSRSYLEWTCQRLGCEITVVDHVDAPSLDAHVRPSTRLVLTETFSNPMTRALDPDAVSDAVMRLRAERAPELYVIVDDTIATPWGPSTSLLSRPGLGVVVGAGTKAVAGQDRDLIGYVVSNDVPTMNRVMDLVAMRGGVASWRVSQVVLDDLDEADRHHATRCATATRLAASLAARDDLEVIHHPSLLSHPDHDVVARAYARPGSMLSLRVRGLDEAGTLHLCNVIAMTEVWRYAVSFDGLVSKVNHHQTVSEYFTPTPRLRRQDIDRLVRLSTGIEDADDVVTALHWALDHHRDVTPEQVARWQAARRRELGID